MIDPTSPEPPVELPDVLADDALLAALGRRDPLPDDEPLARLLASWAAQVDADTDRDLAAVLEQGDEPRPTPVPALAAVASHRRPRRVVRGSRLAVVVTTVGVGLGSLTGVAAAVTGDPLAPYRPVISGVLGTEGAGPSSAQLDSTDVGDAADETGIRATTRAQQERSTAPGERPDPPAAPAGQAGPAPQAAQAAQDGWRAHWPGLPPQAVGPAQRPGLDGTTPGGGPVAQDEQDEKGERGSVRADEVRRDRGASGNDGGAGAAVPQPGGDAEAEQGSGTGPSTPPGHQVPRR